VNHALRKKNLPEQTLNQIRKAVGNGARKLIERVVPKHYTTDQKNVVFQLYQKYYDSNSTKKTAPYPGVLELLKHLKKKGYLLAVVSNKFEHLVQELNDELFEHIFDAAIGEVSGIPIKPAPDMVYRALHVMKLNTDEVVFVGDSEVDIQTAQNAQIKSVGVTWGFRDVETLQNQNPDYMIEKPDELIHLLERI
ncbi:MAG: HAD family hydrolase, partial [Acholeplasmataceae bacterium]|nr:HAD family hydrolase [Acholeplasmataceae bacterium]